MRKRVLSTLLALTMVFALVPASLTAQAAEVKEINIFGIGDFGGALDDSGKPTGNPGGARVVGAMKALTAEAANPIVVTGGTIYTGSAISETNHGKPVNEMLKAMGVQYASVGNHDFDWSNIDTRDEVFNTWQTEGGFTFLNANVYYTQGDKAGQRVFTPYATQTVDGVKIGFFGVIGEDNMSAISALNTEGIEFRPATEAGIEMAKLLRSEEKCDVVIALAHVASVQDAPYDLDATVNGGIGPFIEAVNAACKEAGVKGLDGVMGSQTTAPCLAVIDGTAVVKAQNYGRFIDQLNIKVEGDKVTVTPSLHPLTQITMKDGEETVSLFGTDETTRESQPEDAAFKAVYDEYNDILTILMDAPRGTADAHFSYAEGEDRFNYQKWYLRQNWYYVNEVYGEPIVAYFQNTGGIRNIGETVVEPGDELALRLLYTVAPFDNYIVTMDMTGKDIKTLLAGESQYGKYTSLMQYGLDVTYAAGEFEANGEVESVKLNGQELEDEAVYHIACNTFLYPGPGDSMDFSAGQNAKNINVINRNAVLGALLHQSAAVKDDAFAVTYDTATVGAVTVPTYNAKATVTFADSEQALSVGRNEVKVTVTSPYTDPYATPAEVSNDCTVAVIREYADQDVIPADVVDAVTPLTVKGIFQGNDEGKFNAGDTLTMDQMSVILARACGADLTNVDTTLVHGEVADWAAPSVAWLIENIWPDMCEPEYDEAGNITGYGAYLGFAVYGAEGLTNELAALAQYLGAEIDAAALVESAGLEPNANITRGQVAVILAQLLDA
ncbi:bifunctional metallophosphatase/5'-nucleotidase [Vermiculatibacterium agrestimuris]|uniref:bifunctional metallophosphatase/5'-nucleotidase n=1 Tax=Vermiculatibacterium agrestimuris TaxID=2941519 RepID=UPI0020414A23|nr:5'-nucleotidase C-terminal domain-containing protein [Vermiculatibacterium agrestimuris]